MPGKKIEQVEHSGADASWHVTGSVLMHGGENIATVVIALQMACFYWFAKGRAEKKKWGSDTTERTRNCLWHAALLFASVIYVEVLSGCLHIVLDNPLFNDWPLIGPAAVGFQHHHHDPAGITRGSYFNFLREHYVGMAVVGMTGFLYPRSGKGANTLYLFLAEAILLSSLMMASHRWSHTPPTRLPYGVATLQNVGLLMTQRHHSLHHVGYKINFAIFNGWANPMLNFVTSDVLDSTSKVWVYILLVWASVPLGASWVQLLRHKSSLGVQPTLGEFLADPEVGGVVLTKSN